MIGLVLVTHGRLADEFKAALEHVMGPQKQIEAVTIGAEDDSDLCRNDIIEAVNRVDSGDGVETSRQGELFEPFFTSKPDGTGLGLSLSRAAVEAHGGTIRAESEGAGKGSRFIVEFPST